MLTLTYSRVCRAGASVLTAAVLSGTLAGCSESSARTFDALFPQTSGLFVGNDVGVLGVPVGKVTAITPEGTDVRVTLTVTNDAIKIPAAASAVVVSRSVATDRYVELTPVYSAGPVMPNNAVIPESRTASPVDYDEVLSSLTKMADGFTSSTSTTHGLSDLVATVATSLAGNGQRIHDALATLSGAVAALNAQKGSTLDSISALAQFTNTLARNDATVRAFMGNLASATTMLDSEKGNITTALTTLSSAVQTLAQFSSQHRGELDRFINDLTVLLRNTDKSQRDLKETLEVGPLSGQNFLRAIGPDHRVRVRGSIGQALNIDAAYRQLCSVLGPVCGAGLVPSVPTLLNLLGVTK